MESDSIPQGNVQCRHGHDSDAHTTLDKRRAPHFLPQRLDIASVLANQQRGQHLLNTHIKGADTTGQRVQITNASDTGGGFNFNHQQINHLKGNKPG